MKIRANGISIEVEDTGEDGSQAARPVVLLVMGLGMQLVAWPPAFVDGLVDAGFRVVRFDNRDIGLSQSFDQLGTPNVLWATIKYRLGLAIRAPYTLSDMAADAVGVLDALGIAQAHVVGVSMGGMIAQRIALAAPQRVLSLTSIMSSSGARGLPQADPKVVRVLMGRPASGRRKDIEDHYVRLLRAIGSPGFPTPEADLRERIFAGLSRRYHPKGVTRQMVAIAADAQRAAELPKLQCRTLVLHGRADPLVPYPCGEDTARRIPGARLVGIDGMGHDLAPGVVERLLAEIVPFLRAA